MNEATSQPADDPAINRRKMMRRLLGLLAIVLLSMAAFPCSQYFQRMALLDRVADGGGMYIFSDPGPDWLQSFLSEKYARGFLSLQWIAIPDATDDDLRIIAVNYNDLTDLTFLDNSLLTHQGWNRLSQLSKMRSLQIIRNATILDDPSLRRCLMQLDALALIDIKMTDERFQKFKDLTQLQTLSLNATALSEQQFAELKNFDQLETLILSTTPVTDGNVAQLKSLRNLVALDLKQTNVTDDGMSHFKEFPKLIQLDLSTTNVTDAGLEELANLKSLTHLSLKYTKVSKAGVERLEAALPSCQIEY